MEIESRDAPHLAGSSDLAVDFDAGVRAPRLVMLVSPTCPVCRAGVAIALSGLDEPVGSPFELHIVWLPVLDNDDVAAARGAAQAIGPHPRTRHYFDDELVSSSAARAVLEFAQYNRRVAWDLYLFYRPGRLWIEPLPMPDIWLHQLDIADQPSLDDITFRAAVTEVLLPEAVVSD